MDEESRISSSHHPSTSYTGVSESDSEIQKTSDGLKLRGQSQQQEQPCTSKSQNMETRDFGYSDALPFAPWRRKRYGLTVQGLHEEIVDLYHWIKPNEIEVRLRTKVYEKVRDSVSQRWQHKPIKISMFGSLRTNLFLPTSDIDVLVECDDWVGTPGDWLGETARGLENDNIAESVTVFGGAFVPIVKMVDRDTRLSIDISFNTVQGVRAASYIAKVKEEFPLIEPLVLLLKQFLHYRNLNQTFTGGLSSYGLVLLLVNFFQLYALNMRHRTIYDSGVNLGHLLLRFLEVYSMEFNYEEIGISPGQCCYISKSAAGARYGHKRAQPGNLALEDPLLTANDVGRSTYNFSSIANAFGQAFQILAVAVTLRERKGRNQLSRVYKGSLLHMIMPFTSKELTYRNWLMSGVMSFPSQDTSVTYNLNQLHNTLVSPMIDLSRYAWLRKTTAGAEKRDSRPLKITNPADDVRNQVLLQLRMKEAEESKEKEESVSNKKEEQITATTETETEEDEATSISSHERQEKSVSGRILTGPPLPTSTASVNTSATVSTAASISEREDTDSPELSSSLGNHSSEEDDDDPVMNDARKKSTGGVPVQFKKQFSDVVKTPKEFSRKTQTNFDDNKTTTGSVGQSFMNNHLYYPEPQPTASRRNGFLDYAAVAAASCGSHKHRQTYAQRNRQSRNHSQGSDASDGYDLDRKGLNNNNSSRARRNMRVPSNSSNRSRHSSDSRSRGRPNQMYFPMPPPIDFQSRRSQFVEANLTEENGHGSSLPLITDEPRSPRMYADAVKKKSSLPGAPITSVDLNLVNGNTTRNGVASQASTSMMAPVSKTERSYRNAVAIPSASQAVVISQPKPSHPTMRKDNDCGLDTQSLNSSSSDLSRQPQLVPIGSRLTR
ncbi:hypothetical protein L5515_001588 [Caenorhabditis briggsae]|uniref:Protein CBR-GLD-4 n=1 Tax=Caenorhabditis briggsae TaxID=6238 RepID=A0AAE9IZB0_CAEBR|nr:hypothetical protein L3Y34_015510 [Caenorhabditis briggsae]UMM13178.1 hypothetical protein L5515_001588 [Caenorhabditis briggsae]